MIFLVSHGYYEEALAIFRAAAPREDLRGSLKLYFALWLHEMAAAAEPAAGPGRASLLEAYKGERWPTRLAEHAQGKLSFDDLLRGASDSGEQRRGLLLRGPPPLAQRQHRRREGADAQGRSTLAAWPFFEYDMAQSYLEVGRTCRPRPARLADPGHALEGHALGDMFPRDTSPR